MQVGTYNRTGKRYRGHYSIWVTNEIQELTLALDGVLINPPNFKGHINGNFYSPTKEVIGVLPVPSDLRARSSIREYTPSIDGKRKFDFLARLQGTAKAVLPIHTTQERALYRQLMQRDPAFNTPSSEPQWSEAVKVWNALADRDDHVYYKVCHLSIEVFMELITSIVAHGAATRIPQQMESQDQHEGNNGTYP